MNHSFDLVKEPWIPCVMENGSSKEMGLQEVLERASEIRGLFDPSPVVAASLHRLLLAILHRNFGPKNRKEWKALWTKGCWDREILGYYFNIGKEWFDLFHPDKPFYQISNLLPKSETEDGYALSPAAKLDFASASGNNFTLFDHSMDDNPSLIDSTKAARLVVACQAFHPGGLVSDLAKRGGKTSETSAPLAKGALVLVTGNNLFETLMLNLVVYNVTTGEPFSAQDEADCPAWEQKKPVSGAQRAPLGYLDYLTWQSRGIRLFPETVDGQTVVKKAILAGGTRIPPNQHLTEPMFAFHKNIKKNPRPEDPPWLPLRFRASRALWRDSTRLITAASEFSKSPKARKLVADLVADGTLDRSVLYHFNILGLGSNQAKIDFWRYECLPFPVSYVDDSDLVGYLKDGLDLCSSIGGALWASIKELPDIKERDKVNQRRNAKSRLPDTIVAPGMAWYWSSLEYPFNVLLESLPEDPDGSREQWASVLKSTARKAFEVATRGMNRTGSSLRAITKARNSLERRLWHY